MPGMADQFDSYLLLEIHNVSILNYLVFCALKKMANKMSAKKHTVHSFHVYFKPIALRLELNQFFMNIYPGRLHLKPVQLPREF